MEISSYQSLIGKIEESISRGEKLKKDIEGKDKKILNKTLQALETNRLFCENQLTDRNCYDMWGLKYETFKDHLISKYKNSFGSEESASEYFNRPRKEIRKEHYGLLFKSFKKKFLSFLFTLSRKKSNRLSIEAGQYLILCEDVSELYSIQKKEAKKISDDCSNYLDLKYLRNDIIKTTKELGFPDSLVSKLESSDAEEAIFLAGSEMIKTFERKY